MEDWKQIKVVLKFNIEGKTRCRVVTMGELVEGCDDTVTLEEAYDILKTLQKKYNMQVKVAKHLKMVK